MEIFDVLIVGAGLSGIGTAWHLQHNCPGKSYAILESRGASGGTWDLFRYPGIRSDSDMHTLGYRFKPWIAARAIADGPSILDYVRETARENDIERHIRYHHKVTAARWSSAEALWRLDVETPDGAQTIAARMVIMATGYYRYDQGYRPDFPGEQDFSGRIIHPQTWPEDLDWSGQRIVVIGSGATAMTLVPELAVKAAHVTMLQRSPTYVVSRPAVDDFANTLRRWLPAQLAYTVTRLRNTLFQQFFFRLARRRPDWMRERLAKSVANHLPGRPDLQAQFQPHYNPWDQRLCLVPDGDLFKALKSGRADVVTDRIARFDAAGIVLESGSRLDADVIVTATGLDLQIMGGATVSVDETIRPPGDLITYKGIMFEGVPNFVNIFGYTNASWTLKADLSAEFACRLIAQMDRCDRPVVVPVNRDPALRREPFLDFSSGYITRVADRLPSQGATAPWRQPQNYLNDFLTLKFKSLDDGVLEFRKASKAATK